MPLQAFMLPIPGGPSPSGAAFTHRFALWHPPQGRPLGAVLYVHPLAEELNKTRRMAALQARALASAGFGVLQIDLLGCGDSPGDFEDARWTTWLHDLRTAAAWLRAEMGEVPLTLWGLRGGCLLAAEVAAEMAAEMDAEQAAEMIASRPQPCHFLFWQPVTQGEAVLRQWLRQAAAAALLDGGSPGVVASLQAALAEGRSIEIGGYRIHPALANSLAGARLQAPARCGPVAWLEVRAGALPSPHPSQAWAGAAPPGRLVVQAVPGPPFWQTSEIELAPALIESSTALLVQHAGHAAAADAAAATHP